MGFGIVRRGGAAATLAIAVASLAKVAGGGSVASAESFPLRACGSGPATLLELAPSLGRILAGKRARAEGSSSRPRGDARCRDRHGGNPPGEEALKGAPTKGDAPDGDAPEGDPPDGDAPGGDPPGSGPPGLAPEPPGEVDLTAPGRCDFIDPAKCLFPWPNDHFTAPAPHTDTGLRLALRRKSMPRNRLGIPVEPGDYNRNDGFSPGQLIVTKVPGLETPEAFEATGAPPITDVERSLAPDSPVVVIDAETGEPHPVFSELDANPASPADVALLIRPAVNFAEGRRYVVALRNLRDAAGEPIPAARPFELYRDAIPTRAPAIEARRDHFEALFGELGDAGVEREDLYLAWDFTVASERNLSERILSIRDAAFAELGDADLADLEVEGHSPDFLVTGVTDYERCGDDGCGGGLPVELPDLPLFGGLDNLPVVGGLIGPLLDEVATLLGSPPEDDLIARKVEGQVVVPCYTNLPLCPTGSRFAFSSPADTIPDRIPGNVTLANFTCIIPRSAIGEDASPARPSLYGHGLLGSAGEVQASNVKAMASEHNMVFCATDWAGFATQDAPTVLTILQDLSNFPRLADRTQQGLLNFMFLGRAMIHPQGLSSHPAFRTAGEPVIDRERLYYDGNSQGGILGGALTAVAPDFDRAVLGVPGMNYSTLLRRSSDFGSYAEGEFVDGLDLPLGLYDSYPDELERPLLLSLIQTLWDRGEANGYAHHMTSDPLPNTPPHEVLLHVAFGDHQVSMWTAEIEARTIGAPRHAPTTDPGRHPDSNPYFGIPGIEAYPFDGSALVVWDSGPPREGDPGVVAPPTPNTHPDAPEFGRDPHGDPRSDAQARVQKSEFLRPGGRVVGVCGPLPCYTHGWTGP